MTNEDIIDQVKAHGDSISLAEALRLIGDLGEAEMTQFRAIVCLKSIFPELPLRIATEASTSQHIIGEGGLTDMEVGQLQIDRQS